MPFDLDNENFEFFAPKNKVFVWKQQSFIGIVSKKAHLFRENGPKDDPYSYDADDDFTSLCFKVDSARKLSELVDSNPSSEKDVCKVCLNKYKKLPNNVRHWRDIEFYEQNKRDMEEYTAFVTDDRNYDMAAITPHIPNDLREEIGGEYFRSPKIKAAYEKRWDY